MTLAAVHRVHKKTQGHSVQTPPSPLSLLFLSSLSLRWTQTVRQLCETRVNRLCNIHVRVFVPVLKMRSHAAVWFCHVLVLRLLWSSTGVMIIMPNVLIIYTRQRGRRFFFKDLILSHCNSLTQWSYQDRLLFLELFETFGESYLLLTADDTGLTNKIPAVTSWSHQLTSAWRGA